MINKIEVATARERIEVAIFEYERKISIFEVIGDCLRRFDGKPYTKHMANAVQKFLDDRLRPAPNKNWNVKWAKNLAAYYLIIHGNGISYHKRISIILGYCGATKDANNNFDFSFYQEKYLSDCENIKRRVIELHETIANLPALVGEFNRAVDTLLEAQDKLGYASHYLTK